jgi:hypothetical protein
VLAPVALSLAFLALTAAPAAWSATTLTAAVNGVFPGAGPNFVSGLTRGGGGFGGFGGGGRAFGPPGGGRFYGAPGGGRFNGPSPGGTFRGAPPAGLNLPGLRPGGTRAGGGLPGGFGGGDSADITAALKYAKAHAPGTRWALIVSSEQAAAQTVIKGESVAAMGGFTGRETVLTSSYLSSLVASGEARYFLLGGGGGFGPGGGNNAAVNTITSTCRQVASSSWAGASGSSSGTLYDCAGKAAAIAAS